jgi:hypothetical protein
MTKPHIKPTVVIPPVSDEKLAMFLGCNTERVAQFTPAARKRYEALHDAERRIKLWQSGEGPKPTDILIDEQR